MIKGGFRIMMSKDLLIKASSMTSSELAEFISKQGKKKEPQCYNVPWDFIIDKDKDNSKPKS